MREDVTDTFCKQWVEDCQLRRDAPGDPVPRPPPPRLPSWHCALSGARTSIKGSERAEE